MLCFYVSVPIYGSDNKEGVLRLTDEEEKAFFDAGKGYNSNLPEDVFDLELLYWAFWDTLNEIGIANPMKRIQWNRPVYEEDDELGDPGDELIAPIYSDMLYDIKIGSGIWDEYAYEQNEASKITLHYWDKWFPGVSRDKLITWNTIKELKNKEGNIEY